MQYWNQTLKFTKFQCLIKLSKIDTILVNSKLYQIIKIKYIYIYFKNIYVFLKKRKFKHSCFSVLQEVWHQFKIHLIKEIIIGFASKKFFFSIEKETYRDSILPTNFQNDKHLRIKICISLVKKNINCQIKVLMNSFFNVNYHHFTLLAYFKEYILRQIYLRVLHYYRL